MLHAFSPITAGVEANWDEDAKVVSASTASISGLVVDAQASLQVGGGGGGGGEATQ